MSTPDYSHEELVTAVWYKTVRERAKNPTIAHNDDTRLMRGVAMVFTPTGFMSFVAACPADILDQFAKTVTWWRAETNQTTGVTDVDH